MPAKKLGGVHHQPHPGTRIRCCRCSLPGLTGFTTSRCGGTDGVRHRTEVRPDYNLKPGQKQVLSTGRGINPIAPSLYQTAAVSQRTAASAARLSSPLTVTAGVAICADLGVPIRIGPMDMP